MYALSAKRSVVEQGRWWLALGCAVLSCYGTSGADEPRRPNVLVIMTDDQGYGDLSITGNTLLSTPRIDSLARQGVRLNSFFVSPVCTPTRAALMTGRYPQRTGAIDTYIGRAMMFPDEVTLAEMLRDAGYRTGIFGKWHLGDSYPMRAMDQGFETSLVHRGGGIGQPSDPPGGTSYHDPTLFANGRPVKRSGYVTDVLTTAAIRYIEDNAEQPFLAYVAYNCPHDPLEVPAEEWQHFKDLPLPDAASEPKTPKAANKAGPKRDLGDRTRRVYAMVANIDRNVGRLLDSLDRLGLRENTIVVFLTDNGPAHARFNAGMRGQKGSVYEGGIRVPCFVRYPERLEPGRIVETSAAHIDVVPTLLELCRVSQPARVRFDGVSLAGLLDGSRGSLPSRPLVSQWHRGDQVERMRAATIREGTLKLVQAEGVPEGRWNGKPRFELFDVATDPGESRNLASARPEDVVRLRAAYDTWFDSVVGERGGARPRIIVGTTFENPTTLTRQDWRGPKSGWGPRDLGHWELNAAETCQFELTVRLVEPIRTAGSITVRVVPQAQPGLEVIGRSVPIEVGKQEIVIPACHAETGDFNLEVVAADANGEFGVHQVELRRPDVARTDRSAVPSGTTAVDSSDRP